MSTKTKTRKIKGYKNPIEFDCECAGGKRSCGSMEIADMGGCFEINWIPPRRKKAKGSVVILKEKNLKKIVDYLTPQPPKKRKK